MDDTLSLMDSTLSLMDSTLSLVDSTLSLMDHTLSLVDNTLGLVDSTLSLLDSTLCSGLGVTDSTPNAFPFTQGKAVAYSGQRIQLWNRWPGFDTKPLIEYQLYGANDGPFRKQG